MTGKALPYAMVPEPRLLILDDDIAVGQTLQTMAELDRFSVRTTTHADEFFQVLDAWRPTHIALDLVMPGMDGVQVLNRLAGQGIRARIIVTSGVGQRILDAAARTASEQGLDIAGILPKPFSAESFRRLLAAVPTDDSAPVSTESLPTGSARTERRRTPTAEDLRTSLERRELRIAYQPKIECATGAVAGFEALARWSHPQLGQVPPPTFIPIAEDAGLIGDLTLQVLDQALTWFAALPTASGSASPAGRASHPLTLSVNLSAQTVDDEALAEKIDDLLESRNVAPERLIFELTETSAMRDPTQSLALLTRLRMKGYNLSIDDFGTGYSSMVQLVRLPFSEIKVDKSFVMTAPTSEESRAVIRSIVELGHSLGLTCTAEGVEDGGTLDYLKDLGAEMAQGYYVARPMHGEAAEAWLRGRAGR